jgi:hypothetical protein
MNIPALRTMVVATFLMSLRLDFQSIGIGMNIRYGSVRRLAAKVTAMTGLEIAGWHTSGERNQSKNDSLIDGISRFELNGGTRLTAGIRIDLPIFVKWSA